MPAADTLEAARIHPEPPQKLYIWKQSPCYRKSCSVCTPAAPWCITERATGARFGNERTWAEAVEHANFLLALATVANGVKRAAALTQADFKAVP